MLKTFSRRTIIKFRSQTQKRNIIRFTETKQIKKNIKPDIKEKYVSSYIPAK